MVNERYPSDCIIFRYLVRPDQPQYLVAGYQQAMQAEQASASATSSAKSLPLKPDKAGPFVTPSQTEGSDELAAARQLELAAQKTEAERAIHAGPSNTGNRKDALDEAILEAREVEGLVSVTTGLFTRAP